MRNERDIETDRLRRDDETRELEPLRVHHRSNDRDDDTPPSGSYRRDRNDMFRWMMATLGLVLVALCVAVIKHEVALAEIRANVQSTDANVGRLMDYFKLQKVSP